MPGAALGLSGARHCVCQLDAGLADESASSMLVFRRVRSPDPVTTSIITPTTRSPAACASAAAATAASSSAAPLLPLEPTPLRRRLLPPPPPPPPPPVTRGTSEGHAQLTVAAVSDG